MIQQINFQVDDTKGVGRRECALNTAVNIRLRQEEEKNPYQEPSPWVQVIYNDEEQAAEEIWSRAQSFLDMLIRRSVGL
jgi:hypothetical protein